MIKDYLIENQPIFYRLIQNEFASQKIPHAFILVGNNTERPLQFLAMSLICQDTLACEKCQDCLKVKNNQYADIITIDGQNESIKKRHIEHIQEEFKKTAIEGQNKIYIIKNIENSTKEAMNSLLKMLEEPIEGIYSIFTTKNMNKVLPTIQSRCQVIEIKPDSQIELHKQLIADGIELEKANLLCQLCQDFDEACLLNNERFDYILLQAVNFIEDLFQMRQNLIINTQTNMLMNYKEKDDIKLFLNLIVIALKDMFHVKHNQPIQFVDHFELFNSLQFDNDDIIKKIELVLETIYLIDTNANLPLLMDSLMYRL